MLALLILALGQIPGDTAYLAPKVDGKPTAKAMAVVDLDTWRDRIEAANADDFLRVVELEKAGRLVNVPRGCSLKVIRAYRDVGVPDYYPVLCRVQSGPFVNRRLVFDSDDLSATPEQKPTTPD